MDDSKTILQKYWGFENFRPPQEEIIQSVLKKKDTIALLPTGGGKSVCFQIPALIFEGKTLVISPLIALMQDQVESLTSKGIKAKSLNANLSFKEIDHILENFVYGDLKLLYISPERITSEIFLTRIIKTDLSLIAVDEAHCISQWGYDFRPAYFNILKLRDLLPKVPIVALTATATKQVLIDINSKLNLQKAEIFTKSFTRENLGITIIHTDDKRGELIHLLSKVKGCAIIYVRNRKETIELGQWLSQLGILCVSYHGGMERSLRDASQQAWMTNKVRLIISTNAFGMGIDKPDVRLVVHFDVAPSLEEFYQEAGRAGRDGKESFAVSILDNMDIQTIISGFEDQYPTIEFIGEIYDKLCRFYKVAYGSGNYENYDFDIISIAEFVNIPVRKVYHALNVLEKEAWIIFSEAYKEPSRVMIIADHTQLYFDDNKDDLRKRIITHLLRKYEGLFSDPVKVDETRMAKDLEIDEIKLIHFLNLLKSEGIIYYQPRKSAPQIVFIQPRLEINSFSIDTASYLKRKKMAKDRLNAMLEFVKNEKNCRQKMIVEYFGEIGNDCGKCDICLGASDKTLTSVQLTQVLDHLKKVIQDRPIEIKRYAAIYPFNKRKKIINAIKHFEKEKLISIDNQGFIKPKSN